MGSRSTQVIGLSEKAREIVAGEEVEQYRIEGKRFFPDGRVEEYNEIVRGSNVETAESGYFEGMFGEHYPLYKHTFPDGRVYQEDVQAEPWSAGPCIFLALKDGEEWVEESLWPEQEIEEA